jgi:uncharacterized CHY-type Zn-finger protein
MNCPSCGAAMRLNADEDCLKCDYCKSVFFPAKDDEGVSVLAVASDEACPICAVPLMHAALAPTPDPHDLQRKINCPHCHQRMDTHFYNGPGNVIIDDCDNCELNWLDHGELMRIVRAPDYSDERTSGTM